MKDAPSKDHILRLWLQSLHPAQDHFWGALVPPLLDAHWRAVYGSILTGAFVAVGHMGSLDVVAGFEVQRSSEGLGKVHVLKKDGPWRLCGVRERGESAIEGNVLPSACCGAARTSKSRERQTTRSCRAS